MQDALRQLADRLTAGGRVPTERELSADLGVSRGAVREQLAGLEILGLVRRTQGSGTTVDVPDPSFVRLYFELALRFGHISHEEIARAREVLELATVREAAVRATPEDVGALDALVHAMVGASAADRADDADEADLAFHRRLVVVAANPVLEMVADGLAHVLRALLADRRRLAIARERAAGAREYATDTVHFAVVTAVGKGDPDAAQAAMLEHFDLHRRLADPDGEPDMSEART